MDPDVTKLQFYSIDSIDKVVLNPETPYTHTNTANSYVNSPGPISPLIDNVTIPNPHSKKCFIRYKWSIDGVNFNQATANLLYGFTTAVSGAFGASTGYDIGVKAAVAMWASDTEIGFQFYNDYHSNASRVVAADFSYRYSHTGKALNYTVEYSLFEIL